MNLLHSPSAKLLLVASRLPWFERAVLKELVLRKDEELFGLLHAYEQTSDVDKFKDTVLRKVVETSVELCHQRWRHLFRDLSTEQGKHLANEGKLHMDEAARKSSSLVYGEIDFFSFAAIMEKIAPRPGELFVDLGHGTGRAVVAASLLYGQTLGRCYGIELVPELHRGSVDVVEAYHRMIREHPLYFSQHEAIVEVEEGDFLSEECFNWTTADIVFVNSTCFDLPLMERLAEKAERLEPGTRIVTLTKKLPSDKFAVVEQKQYAMSWGPATCYIQVRTNDANEDEGKEGSTDRK